MLRFALLSCGPSLALYPGRALFDGVIAVNKAGTAHFADWVSMGDAETWWRYASRLRGVPQLWTHPDALRRITSRGEHARARVYERCERNPWSLFSATAGLKLAATLGATRVECYGCDMGGSKNWDDTEEPTADRTESRWARERAAWDGLIQELEGIAVTRHGI